MSCVALGLFVLTKMKNLLFLVTIPSLSVSSTVIAPGYGFGFLIRTLAPMVISSLRLFAGCFALPVDLGLGFQSSSFLDGTPPLLGISCCASRSLCDSMIA